MSRAGLPFARWWLVVVASLLMGAAGAYQFLWSSIPGPLGEAVDASGPSCSGRRDGVCRTVSEPPKRDANEGRRWQRP
jgi:hypothetical protein